MRFVAPDPEPYATTSSLLDLTTTDVPIKKNLGVSKRFFVASAVLPNIDAATAVNNSSLEQTSSCHAVQCNAMPCNSSAMYLAVSVTINPPINQSCKYPNAFSHLPTYPPPHKSPLKPHFRHLHCTEPPPSTFHDQIATLQIHSYHQYVATDLRNLPLSSHLLPASLAYTPQTALPGHPPPCPSPPTTATTYHN